MKTKSVNIYVPPKHWTYEEAYDVVQNKGPMLAMSYEDVRNVFPDRWLQQPKLRGVRGILYGRAVISREGVELAGVSRYKWHSDLPLDCEFYCHGMNQQDINSAVKRRSELTERLQCHIFDLINFNEIQKYRLDMLREVLVQGPHEFVSYWDGSYFGDLYKFFCGRGYEGIIYRDPFAKYQPGKQPCLLKRKPVKEMVVQVVGRYEGEKSFKGRLGGFLCQTPLETHVNVGGGFNEEQRLTWWNCNKADLPKSIEITYEYLSDDNVPIHPQLEKEV